MDRRLLILPCACFALWSAGCAQEKPAAPTPTQPPTSAPTTATPPVAATVPTQSPTKTPPAGDASASADKTNPGKTETGAEKSGKEKGEQDHLGKSIFTTSGLEIQDIKVGKGPIPHTGQRVFVDYIGSLSDGTEFDSSFSHGRVYSFALGMGEVIKGWDEGVATMHVGGKRILVVPPQLAYGPRAQGKIPPNATLTFIIDLHSVGKP